MNLSRRAFLQGLGGASLALLDGGAWRFLSQDTPVYDVAVAAAAEVAAPARIVASTASPAISPSVLSYWTRVVAKTAGATWLRLMREPFIVVDARIGEHVLLRKPHRFTPFQTGVCTEVVETMLDRQAIAEVSPRLVGAAERYLDVLRYSGEALAERLVFKRQNVIGVPSVLPNAIDAVSIAQDPVSGMTVRGTGAYDRTGYLTLLRFDVVSGYAPHLLEMDA